MARETIGAAFIERIEQHRERFLGFLERAGLEPERDAERVVAGGWTLKDTLGHIAAWEAWAGDRLRRQTAGLPLEPIPEDWEPWVEDFNQREWAVRRERPFPAIWREWEQAHRGLLETLAALPDEAWGRLSSDWDSLAEHYEEHAGFIGAELESGGQF